MAVPDVLRQDVDEADAVIDRALVHRIGTQEPIDIVGAQIGDHFRRRHRTQLHIGVGIEAVLGGLRSADLELVRSTVRTAAEAWPTWRNTAAPSRGKVLLEAARLMDKHREELARLISLEEGKALKDSRGEVQRSINITEFMSGEGRRFGGYTSGSESATKFAFTTRQPLGVVACITPWNFPLAIPAWNQAPLGPYDSYAAAYVHGDPLTHVVAPFANIIRGYQRYVWLPGTVYGLILLAGLAVHIVSAWAADDVEGVLTAELSRPRRRWGIVVERAGAAVVAMAVVAACGTAAAWSTARAAGISLDPAGMVTATVLLVPFGLSFAAIGAVASVWWPRASVGALGIIVFLSYLISELGPILSWPDWVAKLSAFQLYGTPALSAVSWSGVATMLVIVLAGFGASAALMERREVAA